MFGLYESLFNYRHLALNECRLSLTTDDASYSHIEEERDDIKIIYRFFISINDEDEDEEKWKKFLREYHRLGS